jgi:hypothetical protein
MKARLIQIGNSKAIKIPKSLIEQYKLGGEIELIPLKSGLFIKTPSKTSDLWQFVFQTSAPGQKCSDGLAWHSFSNKFENEGWVW